MRTWAKVVLGLGGFGVLGISALIGGSYYWFSKNKGRLATEGKEASTEGTTFGRGRAKTECVDEGVARLPNCGNIDFVCESKNKLFVQNCLRSSKPQPSFCEGVPKPTNILDTARWTLTECTRRGHPSDQPCTRLITTVATHCAKPN